MSVANRNPFAILGDDGEDVAAPRAAPAQAAAPAAAPQPQRNIPGAGNQRRGGARNGAPRAERGADAAVEGEQQKDARGGRARNGESRGRGGRGHGRGAPRGRAFDRHSQTDRVDSQKAVAQGWGGEDGKKELDAEQKAEADAQAEGAEGAAAAATPVEAEKVAEEEEDKTMTLDQYLAAKAGKKLNIESKAPREVASDESAWSKLTKHEKEEADYFASTKTQKTKTRTQKEGKQLLDIEQTFNQPAVQRSGRGGGRGGARGGAPRGERGAGRGRGGRGGRGANASVNLADKNAFPSLA
ncbi:related to RAY38 protein [Ustilago trichophora]|uniref:Related to RAY38 protein n=1 Tax=Ustilago trichophora TaxID=86804 RepID=A0A5C3E195_9BASI|nr:related to RAY38 protein [Ustilago trichophora]